jgi:hypothetical protein
MQTPLNYYFSMQCLGSQLFHMWLWLAAMPGVPKRFLFLPSFLPKKLSDFFVSR